MTFRNRLLAMLPPSEIERLQPYLDPVALRCRQVLHFRGMPIEQVYFVEEGLVSVLAHTGESDAVEVWLVGHEGVVGLPVLLCGSTSPHRRVVQIGGRAWRMAAEDLRLLMEESGLLRTLLLRYVHAVIIQTSQAGACANRHSLQQRLTRWLLLAQYHLGHDELPLTHALLSRLLGARRTSITVALGALEEAGVVQQGRGCITILDRERLEEVACHCHRIIKAAYEGILHECERSASPPELRLPLRGMDAGSSDRRLQ
jgi:CRP-like cAMP-binding protein